MSKSGWRPLPGASRSNGDYLRRLNRKNPWMLTTSVLLLLIGMLVAALILCANGG